jgi:hypothetical protein
MKRRRIVLGSMVLLLILGLVLAACGSAEDPPAGTQLDGKALVEERCTQCHNLQRVEAAGKSADAWASTVERMIGHGAKLNDAEKAAVIDYLTQAYPE